MNKSSASSSSDSISRSGSSSGSDPLSSSSSSDDDGRVVAVDVKEKQDAAPAPAPAPKKRGRGRPPKNAVKKDQEGADGVKVNDDDDDASKGAPVAKKKPAATSAGPILAVGTVDRVFKTALVKKAGELFEPTEETKDGNTIKMQVTPEGRVATARSANVGIFMLGTLASNVKDTRMLAKAAKKKKRLSTTKMNTVTAEHVFAALSQAGFDHLVPQCRSNVFPDSSDDDDSDSGSDVAAVGTRRGRK